MAKSAGPGGHSVGKVYVRVLPDTAGFRKELDAELKAELANYKVDVGLKPDADGFREKVKAETSNLPDAKVKVKTDLSQLDLFQQRMLATMNRHMKGLEVKIPLTADGERLRRQAELSAKKLAQEVKAKIPLGMELAAGQRSKVLADVEAIKHLAEAVGPIKFKVEADFKTFDALMKQRIAESALDAKRKMSTIFDVHRAAGDFNRKLRERQQVEVEVVPDMDMFQTKVAANLKALQREVELEVPLTAKGERLRAEVRARVLEIEKTIHAKIPLDPELAAGHRAKIIGEVFALKKMAEKVGKIHLDVDLNMVKNAAKVTIFEGLIQGVKTAGSVARKAVSDNVMLIITLIAALGAPLLGLISGAIVAIPGILAGIAAPIAAIVLGFKGIGEAAKVMLEPLQKLQEFMSKRFQDVFTPIFQKIAEVMPAFGPMLSPVVDSLGMVASQFTNVITSARGLELIDSFMQNIRESASFMAPAISRLTEGLLKLVEGTSRSFPEFAGMFNGLFDQFNKWVDKITTVGPNGMSILDGAMKGLSVTFGTLVESIGSLIDRGLKLLADPKFQADIQLFLELLTRGLEQLIPFLQFMFKVVIGLMAAWVGSINAVSAAYSWVRDKVVALWEYLTSIDFGEIWDGVKDKAAEIWDGVVDTFKNGISLVLGALAVGVVAIGAEVGSWPEKIRSALGDVGSLLLDAGKQLVQGFINGIKNMAGAVWDAVKGIASGAVNAVKGALGIHSPSTVFAGIGQDSMAGLQDGLEGGFQGVLSRAEELAGRLSDAISGGLTVNDAKAQGLRQQIKDSMDAITLERDQLKNELNGTSDKGQKAALRDQMKQLQTVRDQLKFQSDQLRISDQYTQSLGDQGKMLEDFLTKSVDIGKNFAMSGVKQFQSDIGISGHGAISSLADQGVGFATKALTGLISSGMGNTNIQVNSVDDALAAKQTLNNRKALQFAGR